MTHSAIGAERHLLDPATRADAAALETLLHKDFIEIGRNGRLWSREEIIWRASGQSLSATPAAGLRGG